MCELDFDQSATVWDERLIAHARKEHRCDTFAAAIIAGHSHMTHFSVFDGSPNHEDDEDEDRAVPLNRLPSRLSDAGLRWKYAMAEINERRRAARKAA